VTKCPPEEDLLAFHLGTLPDVLVDAVGDHLEECTECEETLSRFEKSDDLLLAALRKPVSDVYLKSTSSKEGSAEADTSFEVTVPDLPGYEILGRLGRGGMGMVYKALQQRLNRAVALKQLACRRERDMARARREAESLARLQHPNIVQIFEVMEHEGRVYLALELVEGGPLSVRLDGKPQPAEASARLVGTLARAIHYAHLRGIVHRDLKPSNVLLAKSEAHADFSSAAWSGFFPKLTDFGIAKQLDLAEADTREGDVIGTPGYMAPEQAIGEAGQAGPATDVYSLGVLLYELLTGRMPLLGIHFLDTLQRVRNEEPIPPRRLQPRVPRDLNTICLKCLRKEPRQRYTSAQELADDLQRFLDHKPIQARPATIWERGRKWIRRHPGISALTALLVLTFLLGFSLVAWQWQRAEDKADEAIKARKLAQEREEQEKEARLQVQKLVARNALSEGVNLCDNGETARGLLWIVRAVETAEAQGDKELGRAARCNLTAWLPYLVRHQANFEHGSWAYAVAFSPDGRSLATSGSFDLTVRLWDAQGKPRGEPLRHRYPVGQVVFSPNGKTLLTGSGDESGGEGRLYEVSSGKLLASWTHPSQLLSAVFNPKAPTCLTLSVGEAVIRSIPEGKAVGRAIKHPRPEKPIPNYPVPLTGDFSPDGKRIVTAGEDGTARFWDAATGEPQDKILRTTAPILAVAFSPDGRTLLTGGRDGNVRMWDVATGQPRGPVLTHQGPVLAVTFSSDGQIAAAGGIVREVNLQAQEATIVGGEVRLWRMPNGTSLGPPLSHPAPVMSLAFSPKGRRLLTGCEDGNTRLFLVATGEQMGKFFAFSGAVTQVAFSPDGAQCLTADAGGGVPRYARLWQVAPEEHLPRLFLHNDTVSALTFSPDGRTLLSGGDDKCVQLWDVATGRPKGPPLKHPYPLTIAAFSPDGRSLFTFCEDKQGREAALWDLDRGQKRHVIRVPQRLFGAAFCDEGRALLLGDHNGNLQDYDASSGEPVGKPLPLGGCYALQFSRDQQSLLVGLNSGGGAILWDWKTRRQLKKLPLGEGGTYVHFYPDKSGLLLLQNGFAHVWDQSGDARKPPPLFGAEGGIAELAFAPDSRSVLIKDSEARARLLDVATGKRIGPAPGQTGIVHVAFSLDGRHLAVADKRGRIALWETPRPMQGTSQRLRLWAETLTGMELDVQQMIHTLEPDEVQRRRARLDELGGPPTGD
jgi:WD40 repeat protein/serine/threonine protein kinase